MNEPTRAAVIAAFAEATGALPDIEGDEITAPVFARELGTTHKTAKMKLDALVDSARATSRRVLSRSGRPVTAYRLTQ